MSAPAEQGAGERDFRSVVFFRSRSRLCALPTEFAVEAMRPLAIEPLSAGPACVRGVSVIRGEATPVVDPGVLLGIPQASCTSRFLTVRAGDRVVALALEAVLGVRRLDAETIRSLTPLLRDAAGDTVASMATVAAERVFVLDAGRLLSDEIWNVIGAEGVT